MMNRNSSYVPQSTSLFSAILSKSKLEAIRLREDANQMKDITRNNAAWDSHAAYSAIIADDIDTMIDKINPGDEARGSDSPWQQAAIDKIKPLMKELATTMEAVFTVMLTKPMDRTEFKAPVRSNRRKA